MAAQSLSLPNLALAAQNHLLLQQQQQQQQALLLHHHHQQQQQQQHHQQQLMHAALLAQQRIGMPPAFAPPVLQASLEMQKAIEIAKERARLFAQQQQQQP